MKDEFIYYFSGLETGTDITEEFLKQGMMIKGGKFSYLTFRGNEKMTNWLKKFRREYHGKIIIDSGAHAFSYANKVEEGKDMGAWQKVNKQVEVILENPDAYIDEYIQWLEENRDAYDYAVEMDIQEFVGKEKVEEWRNKFIEKEIPIIIVLHPKAGDTIEVLRAWKDKGVTYFGLGDFDKDDIKNMELLRAMAAEDVKIHIFAFTPKDLAQYIQYIDSADGSSWLSAGKLGTILVARGTTYENIDIENNPIMVKKAINSDITKVIPKEKLEKEINKKKYTYLNWYNMMQIQKWINKISKRPAYQKQLAMAERGETVLPEWVTEKDKFGRPKSIYLQTRFNNYRSGVYARKIQENALECNTCVVKDVCPAYQEGALCYFTPLWRKLGAKTRNKEAIIRTLQKVIADKYARLERGKYFESKSGGMLDKQVSSLEMDLVKSLEVLDRVMYGSQPATKINMLNASGSKVVISTDADKILEDLRQSYGEEFTQQIEKKIKKSEEEIEEEESRDDDTEEK